MPNFQRATKKLHSNQSVTLETAKQAIVDNPLIGDAKVGDLTGYRVYKFKMVNQQMLLGYSYDDEMGMLTLWMLGTHQNFYRNLSRLHRNTN